eukprot:TRINITY_DN3489_c3_g1_i1.p1 TRINITY_DN3489_c3_g1~~TRINITY_DN3489_c3_g1_i1.p1  ORF type:complete len:263 (+),score=43.71 TRINITY_DN3489_c3_g1_i1:105-791(+)
MVPELAEPEKPKARHQTANDSGSVWQVVFRKDEPIDLQRTGPWLPVPEEVPRAGRVGARNDAHAHKALAKQDILPHSSCWTEPSGLRQIALPWEAPPDPAAPPRDEWGDLVALRRQYLIRPTGPGQNRKDRFWERISTPKEHKKRSTPEQKKAAKASRTAWLFKQHDLRYVDGAEAESSRQDQIALGEARQTGSRTPRPASRAEELIQQRIPLSARPRLSDTQPKVRE